MIRYEIREICGDWAIYEVRETETEGGEKCLLILNSRSNAEYVKAILEHEAKYPNAAVPYRPEVAQMSDEEVLAVSRMCTSYEVWACDKCPLKGRDVCREEINRRVLEMAEKWLLYRRPLEMTVRYQTLEEMKAILARSMKGLKEAMAQDEARTPHPSPSATPSPQGEGLEACKWISVDKRLPEECERVLVYGQEGICFASRYEGDWLVPMVYAGEITHWMPLPQPPKMKGGSDMADTRIMLTCKHCGAGMCIGKGYDGSYYTVNKNMFHDLNAFYEVHEKGKCSDDADYSQDAKNHFVILEEGETLADVASKSEVAREIFEEIKRSRVMLGHPAKIICFRATPTGEVEETVEGWVVPQSRIEELEKKYIGGKTDEDISD